jgi:hypothetical protein
MGFVFSNCEGHPVLSITEEWYEDFMDAYETLNPEDSIRKEDMQVDNRYIVETDIEGNDDVK